MKDYLDIRNSICRRFFFLVILISSFVVIMPQQIYADTINPVLNGSFEEHSGSTPVAGVSMNLWAPDSKIDNWPVVSGSVTYYHDWEYNSRAHSGVYWVDLNGTGPGVIQQAIVTSENYRYSVNFWMASFKGEDVTVTLRASAAGQSEDFSTDSYIDPTETDKGYVHKVFAFTGDGSTNYLKFESLVSGALGPALDSISIHAVVIPVPTSILLLGSGVIGIVGIRRKFSSTLVK